ncbi:MAG: ribosome maturation factor RimM [Pseudomonadota bacterium]
MSNLIDVGRLTGAYGVQGWVKVHSDTDPSDNVFRYQPWQLKTRHGVKPAVLIDWRPHGKAYVAKIEGIETRNDAQALCPVSIAVERSILPVLGQGEYYWHQLQGCRIITDYQGCRRNLGRVKHIMPTGANDVLVVVGDKASIDQRERLIPYLPGQSIRSVDIALAEIIVDWDPEF